MAIIIPATLDELITVLQGLADLDPIERARTVRALSRQSRAILGDVGEAAIFEAVNEMVGLRRRGHREVAQALGVTRATVNEAITRYRRRHTQQRSTR